MYTQSHKLGYSSILRSIHTVVNVSSTHSSPFSLTCSFCLCQSCSETGRHGHPSMIYSPACLCLHSPQPHTHSTACCSQGPHIHKNTNGQTPRNISPLLLSQQQSIDHVTAALGLGCLHFISSAGEQAPHTPYAITNTQVKSTQTNKSKHRHMRGNTI